MNRNLNLIAVVVIYNQECKKSETCIRLSKITKNIPIRVIIVDNSTIENSNKKYTKKNGWEYLSMNGNVGLSIAYNKTLKYIKKYSKKTIIIWLDDDTEITENYFSELISCEKKSPDASVFVPIIYGKDGIIYSPNERRFFKNKFIQDENNIPSSEKFNAINSCMAVRTNIYKKYRYDESLFMDSVDQKFCEDMCENGYKFKILNVKIIQNFFQRSTELNSNNALIRYKIRIKDFMNYANKDFIHRWLGMFKVWAWGVHIGMKCKSIKFFIICIWLGLKYAIQLSLKQKIK